MANKLDMSLDDIGGGGRGRGSGSRGGRGSGGGRGGRRSGGGSGGSEGGMPSDNFVNPLSRDDSDDESPSSFAPERRGRNQGGRSRATPYSRPVRDEGASEWKRDLGRGGNGAASSGSSGPKKLSTRTAQGLASKRILITNLDSEVTEEDVRDIFEQAGDLTSVVVNTNEDGNSKGTSNVVFAKPSQAAAAVKDFDGAEVDGRPMYLRLVDADGKTVTPAAAVPEQRPRRVVQQNQNNGNGNGNFRPRERAYGGGSGGGSKESLFGSALNNLEYDDDNFGSFGNGGGGGGRKGGGRRGGSRVGRGGNRSGNNFQPSHARGGRGGNRGGGGRKGGGGRGGKGGGKKQDNSTPEDLDAEMDAYFNSKDSGMAE